MPNIDFPTLKTIQLPQSTIQFAQYTPQVMDTTLARNNLDKLVAASEQANKARSAYTQALGKKAASLNPSDAAWFKENIEDVAFKEIENIASTGFYGDLNNRITTLAGELANNKGLIGRLNANAEYNKLLAQQNDRLKRGEIDQLAYDRWLEQNPYSYVPSMQNGVESIGKLADLTTLQNTIDFQTIFERAAKDVEYEQYQSQRSEPDTSLKPKKIESLSVEDMELVASGKTSSTPSVIGHTTRGYQYTRKRSERIIANVRQLLTNPTINLQLQQRFQDTTWQLKKMQDKYDNMSYDNPEKQKLANEIKQYKDSTLKYNGKYLTDDDFEKWVEMNIENSEYAKNLSYNRIADSYAYQETQLGSSNPYNTGDGGKKYEEGRIWDGPGTQGY